MGGTIRLAGFSLGETLMWGTHSFRMCYGFSPSPPTQLQRKKPRVGLPFRQSGTGEQPAWAPGPFLGPGYAPFNVRQKAYPILPALCMCIAWAVPWRPHTQSVPRLGLAGLTRSSCKAHPFTDRCPAYYVTLHTPPLHTPSASTALAAWLTVGGRMPTLLLACGSSVCSPGSLSSLVDVKVKAPCPNRSV